MMDDHGKAIWTVGPEFLGRLIDQHGAALRLYAAQLCDSPDVVVQDALVELAGCRETPERPLAWLYRAVRFRAMTARRSAKRRWRHEQEAAKQRPPMLDGPTIGHIGAETVIAALQSLPENQREVVVAHVWGGLTFEQIGRVTGTSGSTANRRYQAAVVAIRENLRLRPCLKKN